MFTGLIEEIGVVRSITLGSVNKLCVTCGSICLDANIGDSIAINGVCLSVTGAGDQGLTFDMVSETVQRSTLARLHAGDRVNMEASLRAGKRLAGHFVQGHVGGIGRIARIVSIGDSREIIIEADPDLMRYVVEKGSIAIDGISLTVASCDNDSLMISVIPQTLKDTTLGARRSGDLVNIETDILGKYIEKFMQQRTESTSEVTEELLRDAGFM